MPTNTMELLTVAAQHDPVLLAKLTGAMKPCLKAGTASGPVDPTPSTTSANGSQDSHDRKENDNG